MRNQLWPSGSASIVILPSGEDGQELLELAAQWTANWLLTPCFWIMESQIPEVSDGPPDVKAFVLGRDPDGAAERVETNLFWALGSQPFELVRLVAVRSEQSAEQQSLTTQKVHLLASYLDASKPIRDVGEGRNSIGTRLIKLNLVFGRTEESQTVSKKVLESGWDANIVAAPEDRPAPGYFDSFVQHDEKYSGFVLAHIATAAGLWSGLPTSTFELGDTHPTLNRARLQRVFVRAVATDKMAGDLAKWALDQAASPDNENSLGKISGQEVSTIKSARAAEKITELVDLLLKGTEHNNFIYQAPIEDYLTNEVRRGFFEKLGIRIKDALEAFLYLSKWAKEIINRKFDPDEYEAETRGYLPARLDPRFVPQPIDEVMSKQFISQDSLSPELWEFVRKILASAVDSPLDYAVPPPLAGDNGQNLIFSETSLVFPTFNEDWSADDLSESAGLQFGRVDWLDVQGASKQASEIRAHYTLLEPGLKESRAEMNETSEALFGAQTLEKNALIELERAEFEFNEDIEFARKVQGEHMHGFSEKLVGKARPDISQRIDGSSTSLKTLDEELKSAIDGQGEIKSGDQEIEGEPNV